MTANQSAQAKGWREDRYRALIERLIAERKQKGINQQQLARLLGRQQHFISRYETGERRLDVAEFADVAVALGLSPSALIREIWGS
jgi:transcriptional regulator with XRE-family HTH domain